MNFLLDTNCWMQIARNREHAQIVVDLLRVVPAANVRISDYSLHSLINITRRHGMIADLPAFIDRTGFGRTIEVVTVPATQITRVVEAIQQHGLDADDAYQYVAAELHGLRLVSFDADFDRMPIGRVLPEMAARLFTEEQNQPS